MAFTPSKSKKHNTQLQGSLNMNSMMDMMTIILLFLLKSYSTTGALATQSESLKLPESVRTIKPKKELNVSIAKDVILVNEQPVMLTADVPPNEIIIPKLESKLREYAQMQKNLEIEVGKEFTHEVIIQGDQSITYELLFRVMYTCGQSEFNKMRLLTVTRTSVE
ncbi:MAG: biopolymer transporter ExbD [Calditrichia bacterium]|nr:biopolymer transporter ExbD [Calditrichia bacterium]